jgi:sulfide:quinone oxidoreductase
VAPARAYVRAMSELRVVICGGGIAAVEGLLHLRRLAGSSVGVKLIAPNEELVYRPMAVREPFGFGAPRRYPLRRIARDNRAEWIKDSLAWVDPEARVVHTGAGESVQFDALLVAVGGRPVEPYRPERVTTFRDAEADATYHGIIQDIEQGYTHSLVFIQPVGPVWPLPLYELALMTAERAQSMDVRNFSATIVTPERRPLAIFGPAAADVVSGRLEAAGITVHTESLAKVPAKQRVLVEPRRVELKPDRVITMPRIAGPSIRGLAGSGASGFIPIDKHCSVRGTRGRVFAAGDAVDYPIKHGGLGTQMADAAAAAIAKLAGAVDTAPAFNPVIRGKLLTGSAPVYMTAHPLGSESFASEVFESPQWWPADDKVIASELGRYLAGLEGSPDVARLA